MYIKIENGVVAQKQPNKGEGFIEAPDGVVCGMLYDGENFTNPPEPAPTWDEIRAKRDGLLSETDWTQLADAPLTAEKSAAYKTYRQTLRDLPQRFENPQDVVWPSKPGAINA